MQWLTDRQGESSAGLLIQAQVYLVTLSFSLFKDVLLLDELQHPRNNTANVISEEVLGSAAACVKCNDALAVPAHVVAGGTDESTVGIVIAVAGLTENTGIRCRVSGH